LKGRVTIKKKNLIIGDVHGHFKNLRQFLIQQGAINEDNKRINKDTLGVYCTGDLVDGGVNRMGDLLLLEYARDWFDKICIGNHESPFFGGPSFIGLRSHDRELRRNLLQLEYEGKYVPSTVVDDYLLVHGGLAARWGFKTAQDANDVIHMVWQQSLEQHEEVPMLDWIGPGRSSPKWADDTGGIFWLDWTEDRNRNINQVVGHSTYLDGPRVERYGKAKKGTRREHWNIDVGGKFGLGLGGIITQKGKNAEPVFWGARYKPAPKLPALVGMGDQSLVDDGDWEEIIDLDDPDNLELYRELMETA
jgi:hypothetical protein